MSFSKPPLGMRLAVNLHILKKTFVKLLVVALFYVLIFIGCMFVVLTYIKPSKFPVILPIAAVALFPFILLAVFMDARDKFFNRSEDERFADYNKIWASYNSGKQQASIHSRAAYSKFNTHSKFLIFVVLLLIFLVVLFK